MTTAAERRRHERWLCEITGIPTAAGREHRVVEWVRRWVAARDDLRMRRDPAGNLVITQAGRSGRRPMYVTAHLDHPAFVVRRMIDDRTVELEFRGGVHDPYFDHAAIEIFDGADRVHRAAITTLDSTARPFKRVTARLSRATGDLAAGDVGRWRFRGRGASPTIHDGILHTPACDDLAAVAAALSTLDVLRRDGDCRHVGVLLTVAEEVGFVGAIAACKAGTVPKTARLICLENSRSFAESPIGAGPIVRVGDKLSVFSPDLTNRISMLMLAHQAEHEGFRYQRKLMPGGTCEATTFASYGYHSTCICLPLGNYHNMADIDGVLAGKRPARVRPETISVDDYHGMIELLLVCARHLDDHASPLKARMEKLYRERRHVLEAG